MLSLTQLKEVLIKNGVAIKGGKIHSDICKRIVEMYNAGMNGGDISKELNINDSTIYKILNRENVEIRPYTLSNRKYEINENYFDVIENSAGIPAMTTIIGKYRDRKTTIFGTINKYLYGKESWN